MGVSECNTYRIKKRDNSSGLRLSSWSPQLYSRIDQSGRSPDSYSGGREFKSRSCSHFSHHTSHITHHMNDLYDITNKYHKSELVSYLRKLAARNLRDVRKARRAGHKTLELISHGYYSAYKSAAWTAATGIWNHEKTGSLRPKPAIDFGRPAFVEQSVDSYSELAESSNEARTVSPRRVNIHD